MARWSPRNVSQLSAGVKLTEFENKLFDLCLSVVEELSLRTTVRIAGGWVRDKMLQRESHDIDIAVDNMSGLEFASHINKYLEKKGSATHRVGVIKSNPEQSKHIEAATMNLWGQSVDFVALRSETYKDDSRIPETTVGTPLEDAERRDFTINSLFYNLNLQVVEDFTGEGLHDLQQKRLRTPLPARVTFLDDPLRALRAVRFSSRLKFTMDEEIVEAMASKEIHRALDKKVSKERVRTEFDGMIIGKSACPRTAFSMLYRSNLLPVVFHLPPLPLFTRRDQQTSAENTQDQSARSDCSPVTYIDEDKQSGVQTESVVLRGGGSVSPCKSSAKDGNLDKDAEKLSNDLAKGLKRWGKRLEKDELNLLLEPVSVRKDWHKEGFMATMLICRRMEKMGEALSWQRQPQQGQQEPSPSVSETVSSPSSATSPSGLSRCFSAGCQTLPLAFTDEQRLSLLLSSYFLPLREVQVVVSSDVRALLVPVHVYALSYVLKYNNTLVKDVGIILDSVKALRQLASGQTELTRQNLGRVILRTKALFPLCALVAATEEVCEKRRTRSGAEKGETDEGIWQRYEALVDFAREEGIENIYKNKPPITGHDIHKALGKLESNVTGVLIKEVLDWSLQFKEEKSIEDCIEHAKRYIQDKSIDLNALEKKKKKQK